MSERRVAGRARSRLPGRGGRGQVRGVPAAQRGRGRGDVEDTPVLPIGEFFAPAPSFVRRINFPAPPAARNRGRGGRGTVRALPGPSSLESDSDEEPPVAVVEELEGVGEQEEGGEDRAARFSLPLGPLPPALSPLSGAPPREAQHSGGERSGEVVEERPASPMPVEPGPSSAVEGGRGGLGGSSGQAAAAAPPTGLQSPLQKRPRTAARAPEAKGSGVWVHFEVPDPQNDPFHARCVHCRMLVSRGRDPAHLGTTPLWRHVKRHHPGVLVEAGSASAPSASATRAGSGSVPASRQATLPVQRWTQLSGSQRVVRVDHHHLTRLIGEMISTDDQPFQVVENNGFRRILQYLVPEYVIPSRTTFSRNVVPSLYRRCRELVSAELRAAAAGTSVHFTTDLWTSSSGMHASFLALTAHWWGPESEGTSAGDASGSGAAPDALRHRWAVLHVETMDTRHTAEEVAAVLDRQIEEWIGGCPHLSRGFIVTDNGANVTAAVADVMGCVNIRCMAHTLHLTVRDALGLKELKASQERDRPIPGAVAATATLVDKSRKLSAHFHRSEKSRRLLRQRQDDLGLPCHLIPSDVETRWNSTFLLFQRILEQERALVALARDESLGVCDLSNAEWKQMSEAVSALEPFQLATKGLCADTTPLSEALPTALGLEKMMGGLQISLTTPEGRALAGRLRTGVARRLTGVLGDREEYVLACLCHPAFKGNAVSADDLPGWRETLVKKVREEEEAARARRDQGSGSGAGAALAAQPAPSSSMGGQPASASPSPPSSQSSSAASQAAPSQQPLATGSRSAQWFQRFCHGVLPGMREE